MTDSLIKAAEVTLKTCLAVKPNESILLISDWDSPTETVSALNHVGKQVAKEFLHLTIKHRQFDGEELPDSVAQMLKSVDVFLGPTSKSFSHTKARRNACEKGVRGATLPGVTDDMFARLMQADYKAIQASAKIWVNKLNQAKSCHITSKAGTDLKIILGHEFEADDGNLSTPGHFGNLPAGEVMGAPVSANGSLVIEYMGEIITEPTILKFVDGKVVDIQDNQSGQRLAKVLKTAAEQDGHDGAYQIAELGIGLNPMAKISGNVLEDEKVLDTCHLAIGDNRSYPGGTNAAGIHLDGVVTNFELRIES